MQKIKYFYLFKSHVFLMSHSPTSNTFFSANGKPRFFFFGILHTIFVAKTCLQTNNVLYAFSCYRSRNTQGAAKYFQIMTSFAKIVAILLYFVSPGYRFFTNLWHVIILWFKVAKYLRIWTSLAKYVRNIFFLLFIKCFDSTIINVSKAKSNMIQMVKNS